MYPGEFPPASPHILPEQQKRQARQFDRNKNPRIFPAADGVARTLLQDRVRQEVLAGRDVLSVSKTPAEERALAFMEPCYDLLEDRLKEEPGVLSVLVLVPTREAAVRLRQEAERLGQAGGYRAAACYRSGAAPRSFKREQLAAISTATILIATPCKLKDLINSGQVDLSRVFYLVLDGADKMVQMGLEPQVRDIIKRVPSKRQSLLFSVLREPGPGCEEANQGYSFQPSEF